MSEIVVSEKFTSLIDGGGMSLISKFNSRNDESEELLVE